MRLLPAHLREAKDMAKAFKDAMDVVGLTRDCRDPDSESISLQQAQECMANALGYEAGWKEIRIELDRPHQPIYLDLLSDVEAAEATRKMVENMSAQLGFDYAHGLVYNALEIAGVGYSPKVRRELSDGSTPWGVITEQKETAPGINFVTTAGHGGYKLSQDRQLKIPDHLRLDDVYYEEDTDWALVALAFPSEFNDELKYALAAVDVFTSCSVPRRRNNSASKEEAFLSEVMVGYVPPEADAMNRDVTPEEQKVISFLANCVLINRAPAVMPPDEWPSLQNWVATLSKVPNLDGRWPTCSHPWRQHWGQWARMEERELQIEEHLDAMLAPPVLSNPSKQIPE